MPASKMSVGERIAGLLHAYYKRRPQLCRYCWKSTCAPLFLIAGVPFGLACAVKHIEARVSDLEDLSGDLEDGDRDIESRLDRV